MSSVLAMQSLCPDCRASLTLGMQTVRAAIQTEKTLPNRMLILPGGNTLIRA
jgi:hypothetical protein